MEMLIGLPLAILLACLIWYYYMVITEVNNEYGNKLFNTKKEFYRALIPFIVWVDEWKKNFNNLK